MEAIFAVIALIAVVHAVSVEMRLADLTRRLESEERSTERLSRVWWQGVSARYQTHWGPDASDPREALAEAVSRNSWRSGGDSSAPPTT